MAYDPNNIAKYYYCRERFRQAYISIGNQAGQSIPFANRRWDGSNHILHTGESTNLLGSYIALLSLEYKIFRDSNLNTRQTIEELYFALEALNRLDFNAEPFTGQVYPRSLNGYLVRNDIDVNSFLQENPNIVPSESGIFPNPFGYIQNSGQVTPVNDMSENSNNPVSRDHIFRIVWGLLLAANLLDNDLSHNNEEFMDGETDLKKECRAIYTRIMQFLNRNNGKIIKPDGDKPPGYNLILDMNALSKVEENMNSPTGYSFPVFWSGNITLWRGWMNGRMDLEKQNLSGNRYRMWDRCWKFGYESYFLYYGMLLYDWPLSGNEGLNLSRKRKLKETTEFYLNVFPCEGNYRHSDNSFSFFGWSQPDRTERSIRDSYCGNHWHDYEPPGNLSSLDFMLMHNLYYLNHFTELGEFPETSKNQCRINCDFIDKSVMVAEINRVKEYIARQAKNDFMNWYLKSYRQAVKDCNMEAEACISKLEADFAGCIKKCSSLPVYLRPVCRLNCWIRLQAGKIRCRTDSLICKALKIRSCIATSRERVRSMKARHYSQLEKMTDFCSIVDSEKWLKPFLKIVFEDEKDGNWVQPFLNINMLK